MAVTIESLQKNYVAPDGSIVPVIDVPHFKLFSGEQVALIGSSGSGKTTLLHLIAGILAPDRGSILFDAAPTIEESGAEAPGLGAAPHAPDTAPHKPGASAPDYFRAQTSTNICALSEPRRDVFRGQHIGYIFQTHHLLGGFTAMENVLLGMSFTGRSADHGWATQLLNEVGLADRLHYKPAKLSLGQQQRVAVARALANRPTLVLADEPTGALDPKNAQQVLDLIRKLCTQVGASLLLVTHDMNIAGQLPRRVELREMNKATQLC